MQSRRPSLVDCNTFSDTIHGFLNYKFLGKDEKVRWAPPSALRRIDFILADEASQYDNRGWTRFFQSVQEQPHCLYVVVVADFQQLQPVVAGGACAEFCKCMAKVTLETVYHSTDEQLFLNRIRFEQPSKATICFPAVRIPGCSGLTA